MGRLRQKVDVNRYFGLPVSEITLERDDSVRYATELRRAFDKTDIGSDYFLYRVLEGDHLDALAIRHLGDSRLWWVLAEINRDVLPGHLDALILPAGITLMIPSYGIFVVTD